MTSPHLTPLEALPFSVCARQVAWEIDGCRDPLGLSEHGECDEPPRN